MIFRRPFFSLVVAALLAAPLVASAQTQHAHVHGQLKLDIAVDGPTVVISMDSPLDNIVGFERTPKTDAERQAVENAVTVLKTADKLFAIDPAANCKLGPVELESAALGLGKKGATAEADAHADLDATFAFNCTNAAAAKYIDVSLFNAFKGMRQIDAQIVAPQGQFQRTLKRPNMRLAWGK